MKRVGILISGGGSNMVALVRAMKAEGFAEPVLVLSNLPDAGGLDKARELGVEVAVVDHRPFGKDRAAFEAAVQAELERAGVEVVALAGFMRILTPEFTQKWEGAMLNIHPSLLPKYKGLHTHERAIEAGDKVHGCSVHLVTAGLDDGPVLGQAELAILPEDTPESLASRLLPLEHKIYSKVLARFVVGELGPIYIN